MSKYKEALESVDYALLSGCSVYDPVMDMEEFLKKVQTALKICHRLETGDVSEDMGYEAAVRGFPTTSKEQRDNKSFYGGVFQAMAKQLIEEESK